MKLFNSLVFCFIVFYLLSNVNSKFEFTNIKCDCPDKNFCSFEYCFLKSVNRSYKYTSVKVNLHKLPITQFSVSFALFKRLNGYKPFLYNLTVDGCKFLGNVKAGNPVAKYFFDFISPYGNMNHKCPFNHDIIVEKLPINFIDYRATKLLPFPEGDYMFDGTWLSFGVPYGNVKFSVGKYIVKDKIVGEKYVYLIT